MKYIEQRQGQHIQKETYKNTNMQKTEATWFICQHGVTELTGAEYLRLLRKLIYFILNFNLKHIFCSLKPQAS